MLVVFDLDGTIALNEHRQHYLLGPKKDYDSFFAACADDVPCREVIATLCAHQLFGNSVEIWSARSDSVRAQTERWLARRALLEPALLTRMRCSSDHRPDPVLKREWLREARAAGRGPDLVYDDRDSVVAMWRAEGVKCFQVAPGPH